MRPWKRSSRRRIRPDNPVSPLALKPGIMLLKSAAETAVKPVSAASDSFVSATVLNRNGGIMLKEKIEKTGFKDPEQFMQSYYMLTKRRIMDGRSRKRHAPANHPWRQYKITNRFRES
jgi:hypothetical protein